MVHKTKFNDNANFYISPEELRQQPDSDEEEMPQNNWNKFQSSSINDDGSSEDEKTKAKKDNKGRVKQFALELVYVNRIIR